MKSILFGTVATLMLSLPVLANTSMTTPSGDSTYEAQRMEENVSPNSKQTTTTSKHVETKKNDHSMKEKSEKQKQEEKMRNDRESVNKNLDSETETTY